MLFIREPPQFSGSGSLRNLLILYFYLLIKDFLNFFDPLSFPADGLSGIFELKMGLKGDFTMNNDLEYVVRDYLEMECMMDRPEQEFLLNFLKGQGIKAESIRIHPAFSIDNCLVVIVEGENSKKRLFYHLQKRSIEG